MRRTQDAMDESCVIVLAVVQTWHGSLHFMQPDSRNTSIERHARAFSRALGKSRREHDFFQRKDTTFESSLQKLHLSNRELKLFSPPSETRIRCPKAQSSSITHTSAPRILFHLSIPQAELNRPTVSTPPMPCRGLALRPLSAGFAGS